MSHRLATLLLVLLTAGTAFAGEADRPPVAGPPGPVGSFKLEGGASFQASTDLDDGGDFRVNRFVLKPGYDLAFSRDLQLSFGLGYSLDRYDFGGARGLAATDPWDDVEGLRFSVFSRYVLDETWTLFGGPGVRFAAERGAKRSDGLEFGFFGGATWKASDTLSIGPGIGFSTEIEDRAVVFPFLLIDWEFAEDFALRTGRGLAATRGPGLALEWEFSDGWSLQLGARWEQLRFRLDDDDVAPDGVGEEESLPVYLALTHSFAERSRVSLFAGVNYAGRVSIYDDRGKKLDRDDYDPALFVGLAFSLTF